MDTFDGVSYWAGMIVLIVTVGGMLALVAEIAVVAIWRIVKAWRAGAL